MAPELVEQVQLNITVNGRRNTFTIENMLVQLMVIRLGKTPNTLEGLLAVRDWLEQRFVDLPPSKGTRPGYARWARYYLITEVADPDLLKQWRRLIS